MHKVVTAVDHGLVYIFIRPCKEPANS